MVEFNGKILATTTNIKLIFKQLHDGMLKRKLVNEYKMSSKLLNKPGR